MLWHRTRINRPNWPACQPPRKNGRIFSLSPLSFLRAPAFVLSGQCRAARCWFAFRGTLLKFIEAQASLFIAYLFIYLSIYLANRMKKTNANTQFVLPEPITASAAQINSSQACISSLRLLCFTPWTHFHSRGENSALLMRSYFHGN